MTWAVIAWIATGLGIVGALLVACRRPLAGQIVWAAGNPLMIAWGMASDVPQTVCLFAVYEVISLMGVWNGLRARGRRRVEDLIRQHLHEQIPKRPLRVTLKDLQKLWSEADGEAAAKGERPDVDAILDEMS